MPNNSNGNGTDKFSTCYTRKIVYLTLIISIDKCRFEYKVAKINN